MSVAEGDMLRVACSQQTGDSDDNINVFHFGVSLPPTPNTDNALLSDISTKISLIYSQIEGVLSNGLTAVDITVYSVSDDRPIGVTAWGAGYSGGLGSGEGMPAADCLLVLLPTSVKRTIGRVYLSPFTEGGQAFGTWTSTLRTTVQDFIAELLAIDPGPNGSILNYGVYKRSDGLLYEPTASRTVPIVAYQRRRKPGRGS